MPRRTSGGCRSLCARPFAGRSRDYTRREGSLSRRDEEHPVIGRFTSELFYAGRLDSLDGLDRQALHQACALPAADCSMCPSPIQVVKTANRSHCCQRAFRASLLEQSTISGTRSARRHLSDGDLNSPRGSSRYEFPLRSKPLEHRGQPGSVRLRAGGGAGDSSAGLQNSRAYALGQRSVSVPGVGLGRRTSHGSSTTNAGVKPRIDRSFCRICLRNRPLCVA